ncbi:class I SAM-dependent methyltransferase [Alphaproteobacteria bacterium]|nr:class I SAM-dependent methyltransferase [Alphaproteobacteria bacterium]
MSTSKSFINLALRIINFLGLKSLIKKTINHQSKILNPIQDEDKDNKFLKLFDNDQIFGNTDFASLCPGLFTSSLQNHGTIHQRIDEASLLWMMVKKSKGKILEIGRAAGGSTVLILGASGSREVVSIDRDPRHLSVANNFFEKEDVKKRLKLYNQTSRKPINVDNYGFLFIDGDHSYDGVCFDIATFWNQLQNNSNSIAVFHDAQKNPISFVPEVKKALDELIDEGSAEVITSWGAQLAVKKIKNIDTSKWYKKIDENFWKKNNSFLQNSLLNPDISNFSLKEIPKINYHNNILGYENIDEDNWSKENITVKKLNLTADSPTRYIKLDNTLVPSFSKLIQSLTSNFTFEIFMRPQNLETFDLVMNDENNSNIFKIKNRFRDNQPSADFMCDKNLIEICDIKIDYFNAYYHFYYRFKLSHDLINSNLKILFDKNTFSSNSGLYLNFLSLDQG